jgi:hypothetical protein
MKRHTLIDDVIERWEETLRRCYRIALRMTRSDRAAYAVLNRALDEEWNATDRRPPPRFSLACRVIAVARSTKAGA